MTTLEIIGLVIATIAGGFTALARTYKWGPFLEEESEAIKPVLPEEIPETPIITTPPVETPYEAPVAPSAMLWDTPKHAFHSLRVMCDEAGLTVAQKNIVCACVYQESQFLNTAIGRNKDPKTGKVWSTDWGIFQVNDTKGWHIGKGLRFSSVQDVLDHPEKAAKWMIGVMKTTGKLQPWASYTTKAYTQWLPKSSPMWKLKV